MIIAQALAGNIQDALLWQQSHLAATLYAMQLACACHSYIAGAFDMPTQRGCFLAVIVPGVNFGSCLILQEGAAKRSVIG